MPQFTVNYAVYGALPGGNSENAEAFNVTSELRAVLNAPGATGVVQCGNNLKGDPSPGNTKHFGALVNNHYFACQEGQTIDFSHAGGLHIGGTGHSTVGLVVKFAVYGALPGGDKSKAKASDVTALLQAEVNVTGGQVTCGDALLGDPSPNNQKHFAAVVNRDGTDMYFACAEGQKIDFNSGGGSL